MPRPAERPPRLSWALWYAARMTGPLVQSIRLQRFRGVQQGTIDGLGQVNVLVDETLWQQFRIECLKRKTSASKEIQRLIAEQLQRWAEHGKGE